MRIRNASHIIAMFCVAAALGLGTGPVLRVHAEHCGAVAGIAIVAGPWENSSEQTSYTVQAQNAQGESCHVEETLRLEFSSTGAGTFISQSGNPVQEWISSGSANRNFYYRNTSGDAHTITVRAGYGSADDWEPRWDTSHNTFEAASGGEEADETDTDVDAQHAGTGAPRSVTADSGSEATRSPFTPERVLSLQIRHLDRGYVHQPVAFEALPSGLTTRELRTTVYSWSFGDGVTSERRTPTHTYTHPGTYIVVATASRDGQEALVRSKVTVLPLRLSLGRNAGGDLMVHNDAPYDVDISAASLSDGRSTYLFPEQTHLGAGSSIALPHVRSGLDAYARAVVLRDRHGVVLAQYPPLPEPEGAASRDRQDSTSDDDSREDDPSAAADSARAAAPEAASDGSRTVAAAHSGALPAGRFFPLAVLAAAAVGILALYAHKLM